MGIITPYKIVARIRWINKDKTNNKQLDEEYHIFSIKAPWGNL